MDEQVDHPDRQHQVAEGQHLAQRLHGNDVGEDHEAVVGTLEVVLHLVDGDGLARRPDARLGDGLGLDRHPVVEPDHQRIRADAQHDETHAHVAQVGQREGEQVAVRDEQQSVGGGDAVGFDDRLERDAERQQEPPSEALLGEVSGPAAQRQSEQESGAQRHQ